AGAADGDSGPCQEVRGGKGERGATSGGATRRVHRAQRRRRSQVSKGVGQGGALTIGIGHHHSGRASGASRGGGGNLGGRDDGHGSSSAAPDRDGSPRPEIRADEGERSAA